MYYTTILSSGRLTCILPICLLLAVSCKKNSETDTSSIVLPSGTSLQKNLDSLYLYAKETYLWYDDLPDYSTFNPRQYEDAGSELSALQEQLEAIAALAVNPSTGLSYETRKGYNHLLYSYIAEGNVFAGRTASVNIEGNGNDMGMETAIVDGDDVYVKSVESGSPADAAGITRGMKVLGIDGINVELNSNNISTALATDEVGLTLQKEDGSSIHVSLTKKSYTASPVLKSTVITIGSSKYGYLALARFSNLASGQSKLDDAFQQFSSNGVTDLVVDLRYNGGGYVETAEYIADLIAPSSINGAVMYAEYFNDQLQQGKITMLKNLPYLDSEGNRVSINGRAATYADVDFSIKGNTYYFSKKGSLTGIKNIVFIVSNTTASASELLINSMKPYTNVKLVGSTTYGKPVGTFGIGIGGFTVYFAQFRLLNASGEGDYYSGIPVDVFADDDVTKDFGDTAENCLNKAIAYLGNKTINVSSNKTNTSFPRIKYVSGTNEYKLVENRIFVGKNQ